MLAGYGVHLGGAQTREHLLRQVNFGRLRQMGDITRVDDQRGLHGHFVHKIDGLRQGAGDVRIRLLVEADVGVADLHEQRFARGPYPLYSRRRNALLPD